MFHFLTRDYFVSSYIVRKNMVTKRYCTHKNRDNYELVSINYPKYIITMLFMDFY